MSSPQAVSNAKRFTDDGFVFPIPLMSEQEAAVHRARLERVEAERGSLHYLVKPYLVFSSAAELCTHPALLDAVESVLGPDVLLWDAAYVIKEPRDTRFVTWHQDLTYWGLDGDALVTAWIALSPVHVGNGCMRAVPGSHHRGRLDHVDTWDDDNLLHRGQDASSCVVEADAVQIMLRPGEASLHHGWVLHASGPNPSDERRIGLTVQFIAPHMRQTVTDRETATLVRGRDPYGHFAPEPLCQGDFQPAAVAFQRQAEALKKFVYDHA